MPEELVEGGEQGESESCQKDAEGAHGGLRLLEESIEGEIQGVMSDDGFPISKENSEI